MSSATIGLFAAAVGLGFLHGIEPGHGWPVAASAALDRPRKWLWGLAAALVLGIGHLISSIAVVLLFFFAKHYLNLQATNDPTVLPGGVKIAGPLGIIAGLLLIGLGIWELLSTASTQKESDEEISRSSGDSSDHHHERGVDHEHTHQHHDHPDSEEIEKRGLWGIASFAFLLGFIHEEEFQIIALCAGSVLCLELMMAYAVTVIAGIVGMTLLLVAGFHYFEKRVHWMKPYFPHISATILIVMGVGFVTGYF